MACRAAERRTDEILEMLGLADKADALCAHALGRHAAAADGGEGDGARAAGPGAGRAHRRRRCRAAPAALGRMCGRSNAAGTTILLTTHYLDEAEELCDRIAIIDHGRLVACDTTAALVDRSRRQDAHHQRSVEPVTELPPELLRRGLSFAAPGRLVYHYGPSRTAARAAAYRSARRRLVAFATSLPRRPISRRSSCGSRAATEKASDAPDRLARCLVVLLRRLCRLGLDQPGVPRGAGRQYRRRAARDQASFADDGTRLPLRSWLPDGPPKAVILALHGFNDYSNAFDDAGRGLGEARHRHLRL